MNKKVKKQTNKIIIVLIIVMLCNFVMPKTSLGYDVIGGLFFKPIAQFIAWFADVAIEALQVVAIGDGTMKVENSPYLIRYSPGVIFSGKIPMFDINFISPDEDYEVVKMIANYDEIYKSFTAEELELDGINFDNLSNILRGGVSESDPGMIGEFFKTGELKTKSGKVLASFGTPDLGMRSLNEIRSDTNFSGEENFLYKFGDTVLTTPEERDNDYKKYLELINVETTEQTKTTDYWAPTRPWWIIIVDNVKYNGVLYDQVILYQARHKYAGGNIEMYTDIIFADFYSEGGNLEKEDPNNLACNVRVDIYKRTLSDRFELVETDETIPSIAGTLKPFVATWFNVFKVVALVALLVVLVYVAIRMILSSTSKDKAKYKKMLVDWVTAICIIFVMQYIISLTLHVTGAITDFFATSVVGEYGEDELMSRIRNLIGSDTAQGFDFMKVSADIVMYVVLVVYTILFTIQYLKRTIYMAFLTLISPLVAFTYPLDKLKDGKAQAFSAWLKEFIYTALVQPVHLIVYCLLVDSAINFAQEVPVYAIIVIGFLLPAEKFVKKMFGLDKANTLGSMASAFGGAAIMNGINKLGLKGPKGPKGNGGSGSGGSANNSNVRTANEGQEDPYDVLREDSQNASTSGLGENSSSNSRATAEAQNKKRNIMNKPKNSGWGNVAKKYVFNKNTAKGLLRTGGRIAGAATLGTIGLAAGIATGEAENAFAGAAGGITAGSRVGANLVDGGANLIDGISGGIKGIGDTFGEGAYGKEEYARMKFDKEFRKTEEYIKLIGKYPGRENDVQQFLNAGITDTKMMQKAMDKNYNIKEAIAYIKMAQAEDCPNEVLYDRENFKSYLEARGIPGSKAEEIRRGILQFK